jgi:hypothetical protein
MKQSIYLPDTQDSSCSLHLKIIISIFLLSGFILIQQADLTAATVVLTSGVTIKGKLIDRSDEQIVIQDIDTRQVRTIKNAFIRDLTLDADEAKFKQKKIKGITTDGSGLLYVLQPELGVLGGIAYPLSTVGKNLALGYGGSVFTDFALPMKPEFFKVRLGLSAGYQYHPTIDSKYANYLNIIPIFLYAKLQFITSVGLRPYLKVGGGYTPVLSSGGNSSDITAAGAIGLGYINNKIPYLEFFIEGGAIMFFERENAYMITANIGIAYRFGAGTSVTTGGK